MHKNEYPVFRLALSKYSRLVVVEERWTFNVRTHCMSCVLFWVARGRKKEAARESQKSRRSCGNGENNNSANIAKSTFTTIRFMSTSSSVSFHRKIERRLTMRREYKRRKKVDKTNNEYKSGDYSSPPFTSCIPLALLTWLGIIMVFVLWK